MEILNTLYNLMGMVFVLGTIISMGLSLTMKQITGPLRKCPFCGHSLVSQLYPFHPSRAFILIQVFSLDEPLGPPPLVSLAAGAPGLPKMAEFAETG